MAVYWYDLEICPIGTNFFYKEEVDRSKANAGVDLYTAKDVTVYEAPEFLPFGFRARMLKVWEGDTKEKEEVHYWLVPRSSIYKSNLIMANSVGVIDASYRGELKAPVLSMTGNTKVAKGDRLFQILAPDMGWIRNIWCVDSLNETERGEGGFDQRVNKPI